MVNSILGLCGGLLFAYAGVPAAFKTLRAHKHLGTPVSISACIFFGTLIMYAHLYLQHGFDWVITLNYSIEALSWLILLVYGLGDVITKFLNGGGHFDD